jgi:hypothetical protein
MAKFSVLEQMVKTRLNSTLSMVMDVNLKQTRRLIFDIFFGKFYGDDIWKDRRAFDVIYELSDYNRISREGFIKDKFSSDDATCTLLLDGCVQLNGVAEDARNMGTTLWYDTKDSRDDRMMKVVACGQFTTCAKLLEYVLELEQKKIELSPEQRKIFDGVKTQLLEDWKNFKGDPYFVYKQLA